MSLVIKWIKDNVRDNTFCDIGGIGLNSLNERISVAAEAKASEATMIDFRRFGFPEWNVFEEKMEKIGIDNYKKIGGVNLEARDFPSKVGTYDFVHCMGILYHGPSPILMLDNLARITRKFLVVNTVIVPNEVRTDIGTLKFPGSQLLFLPGLSKEERGILDLYYQGQLGWPAGRFLEFAPEPGDLNAKMPWLQTRAASDQHFWANKGDLSYSPYWFLFTAQAFRAAVTMLGFNIVDETSFKGHTLTLFCERE